MDMVLWSATTTKYVRGYAEGGPRLVDTLEMNTHSAVNTTDSCSLFSFHVRAHGKQKSLALYCRRKNTSVLAWRTSVAIDKLPTIPETKAEPAFIISRPSVSNSTLRPSNRCLYARVTHHGVDTYISQTWSRRLRSLVKKCAP